MVTRARLELVTAEVVLVATVEVAITTVTAVHKLGMVVVVPVPEDLVQQATVLMGLVELAAVGMLAQMAARI